jgi:protein arginine N-methyltransferase 7
MDPTHSELKRGMEEATQAVVADLLDGRGREVLALPAPTKIAGRIGNLPHAAGPARPFLPHFILMVSS